MKNISTIAGRVAGILKLTHRLHHLQRFSCDYRLVFRFLFAPN